MLRQRKFLVIILLIVFALSAIFCACDSLKSKTEDGIKTAVLVIGTDEITVTTSAKYLHDLLVELNEKSIINYVYVTSATWVTVMKINALETAANWDPFISIYHNIDDLAIKDYSMQNYTYKGVEYYPSGVSVADLPVINNAKYLFVETHLY